MCRETAGSGTRHLAVAALGVSLLVTACTGQDAPTAVERSRDGGGVTGDSFAHAPKEYPLDEYMTNSEERTTVDHAISILVGHCMKEYGLSWPNYEASPGSIPENARKYGVTDLKSVRVYGYKPPLPDGVSKEAAVSYQRAYEAKQKSVTPVAEAAYSGRKTGAAEPPPGVPKGGCSGEARRQADVERLNEDMMTVQNLFWRASSAARKDSRIIELNRRWSVCMKGSGMSYADPLKAVDDRTWRTRRTSGDGPSPFFPAPSREEIRTAEADVKCKTRTGYIEKHTSIEFRYQRKLIEQHAEKLTAVKEHKLRTVDELRAVVAARGAGG